MIEQNVQVVRCHEQRLWVRLGAKTGCVACAEGKGCGAGVFAKLFQNKPVVIELKRKDINVKAGQMVTLAFTEHMYLKMVLAYYGWPLLTALTGGGGGYALGTWLQLSTPIVDLLTLLAGLVSGGIVLSVLRRLKSTDFILNSLQVKLYYPVAHPNMCVDATTEPGQT